MIHSALYLISWFYERINNDDDVDDDDDDDVALRKSIGPKLTFTWITIEMKLTLWSAPLAKHVLNMHVTTRRSRL